MWSGGCYHVRLHSIKHGACAGIYMLTHWDGPCRLIYLSIWFLVGGWFRKDQEVWPCWACGTRGELWGFKPIPVPPSASSSFPVSFSLSGSLSQSHHGSRYTFSATVPAPCLSAYCHTPHYDDLGLILQNCKQALNEVFSVISCLGHVSSQQ